MKIKMISSEDKEEWLKETYKYLQKLKEDKYGDVRLDYIMLYELHEEEHKEIERLNKEKDDLDDCNRHLYNENKKINNVIDELEKYLNDDDWTSVNGVIAIKLIKIKLKELKEGK